VAIGNILTKDVPIMTIVGGNPEKTIKLRGIENFERLKQEKRCY
jgi:acetyltransferase-like isoleucine patch superfamily enzyme